MEMLYLLAGVVAGGVVAWLLARARSASQRGLTREEAAALSAQLDDLRMEKSRLGERALFLEEEVQKLTAHLEVERNRTTTLTAELSRSQTDNANLLDRLRDQKNELQGLETRFSEEFQRVAQRILLDNSQKLQEQHKDKLDDILVPLKERIERFERRVEDTHKEAIRENQSLKEQIASLQKLNQTIGEEAKNLTTALKGQAKTQGNWGEIILEKILERSGLERDREYSIQRSMAAEEGRRLQPDVIIHLPENKELVIDAKVSLAAYERYCSTENESEREVHLRDHISSVRKHLKELSTKNYQNLYQLASLDFVLMFIPVEPAFNVATAADPALYGEAFEKNIVIVSNSSLLATLRTIASIWRQENQNRNAMEIARQGGDLYDKFVGFVEDLLELGKKMKMTQEAYDDAMAKLQSGRGNLVRRAEELRKLGAKASKSLPQGVAETEDEEGVPALRLAGGRKAERTARTKEKP
jgi:DNA recombination protein RmuC